MTWKKFVLEHGLNASVRDLAFLLGVKEHQINYLRQGLCRTDIPRSRFDELFKSWHGRHPTEDEWPPPGRAGQGGYEWLPAELALLASLTGRLPTHRIAAILTKRLRKVTGDPRAERNVSAVTHKHQVTGVLAGDLLGGITTQQAGAEVDSQQLIYTSIRSGALAANRVGRRLLIAPDEWARWKSTRVTPPDAYIRLKSIAALLGISDGGLSVHARAGLIPTAQLFNPYGTRQAMSQGGVWYIDGAVARKLVKNRRAGLPMPWHGVGIDSNLKQTWSKFQGRQHPADCHICAQIWGVRGAPSTFKDYCDRYPGLDFMQKRHLTRKYRPGLNTSEAARLSGSTRARVEKALMTGELKRADRRRPLRVSMDSFASWRPEPIRRRRRRAQPSDRDQLNVTFEEASAYLGKPRAWIASQVRRGLVHPLRDPGDRRMRRFSPGMLKKLKIEAAAGAKARPHRPSSAWVRIHEASSIAGVTQGTLVKWHEIGIIPRRGKKKHYEYHRGSIRRAARAYWRNPRLKRAIPPAWIGA